VAKNKFSKEGKNMHNSKTIPPPNSADFFIFNLNAVAQRKYGGGSGTADDPYQIGTAADLIALGDTPENYDKHFILTADIDLDPKLPGQKVFTKAVIAPGTYTPDWPNFQGTLFTGVFDGNGHTISHLTIKGGEYLGLFGYLRYGVEVKNLGVVDVNITGSGAYSYVGGLAGENGGDLTNCYSTGAVTATNYVGGLVGYNGGDLTRCYSTGAVTGTNCVGGLVGYNGGDLTNCYSTSSVSGTSYVGGLVGYDAPGSITNCYSAGAVSGTGSHIGGLVGHNPSGTVAYSFWDIQTSGQSTSAGGTGKTTAEMQDTRTYQDAGWDFVGETEDGLHEIWQMPQGGGYPILAILSGYTPPQLQGAGTLDHPYLISNAIEFGAMYHYSPSAHYRLTSDIDFSGIPWGTGLIRSFSGTFDGNGHWLYNYRGPDSLFGYVRGSNAEVKNLKLFNPSFKGGQSGGSSLLVNTLEDGTISNCYVQDCNLSSRSSGLVHFNNGTIRDCHVSGEISGLYGRYHVVGGLVAWNGENGTITCCSFSGSVHGGGVDGAATGGLVGHNSGGISFCYSTGSVLGWTPGGLVGWNEGVVYSSYSFSSISGNGVGGLVSDNRGIVGNCYSTGTVSDSSGQWARVGGLVTNNSGSVTGCFWDTQTSGQATSAGGTGKTTAEMQTAKTFLDAGLPAAAGWDFVGESQNGTEDVWAMCEGQDYPKLAWQFVIGDHNTDGHADFMDFCLFAQRWLGTDSSFWCGKGGTDLTNDGLVNWEDLMIFAQSWLTGAAP